MTSPESTTTSVEFIEPGVGPTATEESIPEETESQTQVETSIENLFNNGNFKSLLEMKDNPEAQFAATALMLDSYHHIPPQSPDQIELITSIDMETISQRLNLSQEESTKIEDDKREFIELSEKIKFIEERREETMGKVEQSGGVAHEKFKEEVDILSTQIKDLEKNQELKYKELTFPIRKAILESSANFPEIYINSAIRGLKGSGKLLEEERMLLREQYLKNNESIRNKVIDVVYHCRKYDLKALEIVPLNELNFSEEGKQKTFIHSMGSPDCNEEFIEKFIVPNFFPDYEPQKIIESWRALKEVTSKSYNLNDEGEFSFFSKYDRIGNTNLMNTQVFQEFMGNADELIPIISILKDYKFAYSPNNISGEKIPGYIEKLKSLGEDKEELKIALANIKEIIPEYKYDPTPHLLPDRRNYLEENPFAIAIEQAARESNRPESELKETITTFYALNNYIPNRWESGFLAAYINNMSLYASKLHGKELSDQSQEIALEEINKYILSNEIDDNDISKFSTNYLESALEPRSDDTHIKTAFEFCQKYANKIIPKNPKENTTNEDATWINFSLKTADLYRYSAIEEEKEAIRKGKRDLIYSLRASLAIKDVSKRDEVITSLIYGLTDPNIGDLSLAEDFITLIENPLLKEEAQGELDLERKRVELNETTHWKKIEKIRMTAEHNKEFIQNLFGYGTEEGRELAETEYRKVIPESQPYQYKWQYNQEKGILLLEEIERIKDNFNVSINITWSNLFSVLEKGKVTSIWENEEEKKKRNAGASSQNNYSRRRDLVERDLGKRAKGGRNDPHPIYGAAHTKNGRDELYGGASRDGQYGETFIVLKRDKIKDRTSFCFDDSFNGYSHWLLDWEGGITAKAVHNLEGMKSEHGYVEAQILGGVSIDDIESVNIPSDALREIRYSESTERDVISEIEHLREKYPNIKFNIIEANK